MQSVLSSIDKEISIFFLLFDHVSSHVSAHAFRSSLTKFLWTKNFQTKFIAPQNPSIDTRMGQWLSVTAIDDYAKDGRPGEVWLLCSFYHKSLRTWIETSVDKFAILNHTALKLDVQILRSYLSLICEHEFYILPNKNVITAKDHGKNYIPGPPSLA